ncbi:hypothetical protein B9Z55_018299 [Caenorhabditis nigoni]|uniref:C-type lectin domain-containing protein n=1 Tax=Caenorhabditis nigoni TaxID=1611254 RepID=A0A2G5TE53_9PELO|nr:hypothetical protein B9Z55_018299 [Caenorhabditis nigoni]
MKFSIQILFCFVCPIFAAIGMYNGGRDSGPWSSESSEGHGYGHGHGHGGRPHPPRPPREKTNCPADWMLFRRSQGNWCVKVFLGQWTQPQAEAHCVAQGAKLTGLQTNEERLRLAEAGRKMVDQNGLQVSSVWLGARRKASCPRAGICAAKDAFEWTDGQTTGTDGFDWHIGQPDGHWRNGWGHQDCVLQFVLPTGSGLKGFVHGQFDDRWCQDQWFNTNNKLYACGKLAT